MECLIKSCGWANFVELLPSFDLAPPKRCLVHFPGHGESRSSENYRFLYYGEGDEIIPYYPRANRLWHRRLRFFVSDSFSAPSFGWHIECLLVLYGTLCTIQISPNLKMRMDVSLSGSIVNTGNAWKVSDQNQREIRQLSQNGGRLGLAPISLVWNSQMGPTEGFSLRAVALANLILCLYEMVLVLTLALHSADNLWRSLVFVPLFYMIPLYTSLSIVRGPRNGYGSMIND